MATKRKTNDSENPVVLTITIRQNGEVASIERADGKRLTKPTGNLRKRPVDVNGYKLSEVLSYQMIKFAEQDGVHIYWHPWMCDWWYCGKFQSSEVR